MPDGQEYKSGLYKNLLSAYGKDNLPDEQTFYKKLDTDSTYRDGVYKNLENAYGKDNLPDYATFETKIGVKKKEPTATTSSMPVVTSGEDLNKLALGGGQNQTSTLKLPSQLNAETKKTNQQPKVDIEKEARHAKVASSDANTLLNDYDNQISQIRGTNVAEAKNWKDVKYIPINKNEPRLANFDQQRQQNEGLFLQSIEGKTGKIIKGIVNGEANVDDINYLKDAAPKAAKQVLQSLVPTYNPANDITEEDVKSLVNQVNVIKQDAIATNKVDGYAKLEPQAIYDLANIGAEFDEKGNLDVDGFAPKIQSSKQKEISDLQAQYPLRQERVVAGNGRASMFVSKRDREGEYKEKLKEINDRYAKSNAALGTYAAFRKAKQNTLLDPMQVGLEYLKYADPDAYKLRMLSGVDNEQKFGGGQSTAQDYDIYQMGLTALYGTADKNNKNTLRILSQKEQAAALLHPEKLKAETYQRLGAELYKKQNWFFNAAPSMAEIDEAAKQLPEINKKIYDLYIRPDEAKRVGTKIPISGALNKIGEQFTNTVFSGFKAFDPSRTDNVIALDKINQGYDTQFMDVGTHPDAVSRIGQLNLKAEKKGLTVDELNEKEDLEKYTNVRGTAQEIIDGSAGLVGQVLAQAVGTKGLGNVLGVGANSLGLLKAEQALSAGIGTEAAIANEAVNFGITKATLNAVAADFTALATSYDQARQDAAALFPDAEDSGKRKLYSTIVAGLNAGTERIFKDERVLDAFNREIAPNIKNVVAKLTRGEISKEALQPTLTKIMKNALSIAGKSAVETNKEAFEEVATSVGTSVATAILAPTKFNVNDAYNDAINTYTSMLTNGGVVGLFAGVQQHRANKVGIPLLSQLGVNKQFTQDVKNEINKQQLSGAITQEEANGKIKILNTAAQINTTIMKQLDDTIKLPENARNKYSVQLLNEAILRKQIEETKDKVLVEQIENKIKESEAIRKGIIEKAFFVDDNFEIKTPEQANDDIRNKPFYAVEDDNKNTIILTKKEVDKLIERGDTAGLIIKNDNELQTKLNSTIKEPTFPKLSNEQLNDTIKSFPLRKLKALTLGDALSQEDKTALTKYIADKEAFDKLPKEQQQVKGEPEEISQPIELKPIDTSMGGSEKIKEPTQEQTIAPIEVSETAKEEVAGVSGSALKDVESKKADIERRRQEELNQQTDAGYSIIALDYLFTGGRDVIQSTDYLLQALVGGFTHSAKEINDIRNKYADKLGNIKDDINSDIYNQMMSEIRNVINKNYNNSKATEIFDKILKNATGFISREGNQVNSELDKLNEQNESKINAKYDAELAALEKQQSGKEAPTQYTEAATPAKKESGGVSGSALKDVESTAKALKEAKYDDNKLPFSLDYLPQDHRAISEAYHKAKSDGTNPELVKAVEELIGKQEKQGTQSEVASTVSGEGKVDKALSSVESTAKNDELEQEFTKTVTPFYKTSAEKVVSQLDKIFGGIGNEIKKKFIEHGGYGKFLFSKDAKLESLKGKIKDTVSKNMSLDDLAKISDKDTNLNNEYFDGLKNQYDNLQKAKNSLEAVKKELEKESLNKERGLPPQKDFYPIYDIIENMYRTYGMEQPKFLAEMSLNDLLDEYSKLDKYIKTKEADLKDKYTSAITTRLITDDFKPNVNERILKAVEQSLKETTKAETPTTTKESSVDVSENKNSDIVYYRGTSVGSKNKGKFISDSKDYAKSFANAKGNTEVSEVRLKDGTKIFDIGYDNGVNGLLEKIKNKIPDLTEKEISDIKDRKHKEVLEKRGYDGISYKEGDSQTNKEANTIELFNPEQSLLPNKQTTKESSVDVSETTVQENETFTKREQEEKPAKKSIKDKLYDFANKIEKEGINDALGLPKANLPDGTKTQGFDSNAFNKVVANAVRSIGDLVDAGIKIADAINVAFEDIKEYYEQNNLPINEDKLRKNFESKVQEIFSEPTEQKEPTEKKSDLKQGVKLFEALGFRAKAVQEENIKKSGADEKQIALAKYINTNFDEIVKQLKENDKIEKVC